MPGPRPPVRPGFGLCRRTLVVVLAPLMLLAALLLLARVLDEAAFVARAAAIVVLLAVAAAAAWFVFTASIARPFERLAQAARRMTEGAAVAPLGPGYGPGALGQVERAFDAMAETVARRGIEAEKARRILDEAVSGFGDGLALYDAEERLVLCNEKCRELLAPIGELMVPGTRIEDLARAHVASAAGALEPRRREERLAGFLAAFRTREKNMRTRLADGRLMRSSHYATTTGGTVVIVADISEEVEAAESLRLSEARFRALAETVPIGIYRMDQAGTVVFANDVWRRITGLHSAPLAAAAWGQAVHPEDRDGVRQIWDGALRLGRDLRQEYRVRRDDGSVRWVVDTAAPERDPGGGLLGFVGTLADVTEEREIKARLEQARRLEALGQLTGGIAHDFNNLLMIILGNAEMLEDLATRGGEIKPERLLRLARTILSASERGTALTQNLLAFARRRSVRPEKVAVHRRIEELGELVRRDLGGGIKLVFDLAAESDEVMIDAALLENALIYLASNGRDAMPGGGQMTVSTRTLVIATPQRPEAGDLPPGRYLAIAVADTGSGMSPDVVSRAIEPFFTTKPEGQASGLGLSLAYGVVKQAHGEIKIESVPGKGTVVTLILPLVESASATVESDRAAPSTAADRPRVLVVDDDAPVLTVMAAQLELLGCETVSASSAGGAIRVLQADQRFDLLFSDIDLGPGLDGLALAREARALRPDIRILLTTGKLVERAASDESAPILPKPFTLRELADRLRGVLAQPPNGER